MYGAMISLILTILMFILSIVFKVTGKLRLTLPIVYYVLIKTVFYQFARDYKIFAYGILYGLVGLIFLSWIYSLVKAIQTKRQDRFFEDDVQWQINKAREMGISMDSVQFDEQGNLLNPNTGEPIIFKTETPE